MSISSRMMLILYVCLFIFLASQAFGEHAVIDSVLPEQNTIDVPASTNISVKFKEYMDAGTINDGTFLVHGSLSGRHSGQIEYYLSPSNTARFFSDQPFTPGEVVTVRLTEDIRRMDGTYLTHGYTWSFTAEAYRGSALFTVEPSYPVGNAPTSVTSADLDGNGYNDLIVTNSATNDISIYMGSIMGVYGSPVNYAVGENAMEAAAADIDGDDDLDLVIASYKAPGFVSTMLNNGDGTFTFGADYPIDASNPNSVCIADFDGDGDVDLATPNYHGDNISVLLNDGAGSFAVDSTYASGTSPWSICAADLDNDGYIDLAVADYSTHNVYLYLGHGDGTFADAVAHSTGAGSSPRKIVAADFNGDGWIDLATSNRDNDGVGVMLNLGGATFAPAAVYPAGEWAYGLCAGDFDDDGDIDLLTGNYSSDDLSLLLNDGNGVFSPGDTYAVGDRPRSVCAVDLDNDGDIDVVCANRDDNNITRLFNNGEPTTWYVSTTGDDVSGEGSLADPFATIQHAVDISDNLDTVMVLSGTYTGNGNRDITFWGKLILLKSQSGPAWTIIDCQAAEADQHQGVVFINSEDSAAKIDGFTIQNAYYSRSAGIECGDGASPTIKNCIFLSNISRNTGGGLGCSPYSAPRVIKCTFESNYAENQGGAISCYGRNAVIVNCEFQANSAGNTGGAISCWDGAAPIIGGCRFIGNESPVGAAGIHCHEGSSPYISDCTFEANDGDAINVYNSAVEIKDCVFLENDANTSALSLQSSYANVSACSFKGNLGDFGGGAVHISNDSSTVFSHCLFIKNTAPNIGGAAILWSSSAQFMNCTFSGNDSPDGSAVWMDGSSPSFENCIMAYGEQSPPVACQNVNTPAFTCCNLYGNDGGDWVGCVAGADGINNNFSAWPMFCDTAGGDYHINPLSKCAPDRNACGVLVGALDVGCLLDPMYIEPDPMYAIYIYSVEPMTGAIYLGDFPGVYGVHSVNLSSIRINDSIVPLNVEIVESSMFMDDALVVSFSVSEFLQSYGNHYGLHSHRYSVSGIFGTIEPFIYVGSVPCFGHIPGDMNFDGAVNVADVVYLVNYVFSHGPEPTPKEIGDLNHDLDVNIGDAVYLINLILTGDPGHGL